MSNETKTMLEHAEKKGGEMQAAGKKMMESMKQFQKQDKAYVIMCNGKRLHPDIYPDWNTLPQETKDAYSKAYELSQQEQADIKSYEKLRDEFNVLLKEIDETDVSTKRVLN